MVYSIRKGPFMASCKHDFIARGQQSELSNAIWWKSLNTNLNNTYKTVCEVCPKSNENDFFCTAQKGQERKVGVEAGGSGTQYTI
jgi:hypothetical protein